MLERFSLELTDLARASNIWHVCSSARLSSVTDMTYDDMLYEQHNGVVRHNHYPGAPFCIAKSEFTMWT